VLFARLVRGGSRRSIDVEEDGYGGRRDARRSQKIRQRFACDDFSNFFSFPVDCPYIGSDARPCPQLVLIFRVGLSDGRIFVISCPIQWLLLLSEYDWV
jgi:hypothetical protein